MVVKEKIILTTEYFVKHIIVQYHHQGDWAPNYSRTEQRSRIASAAGTVVEIPHHLTPSNFLIETLIWKWFIHSIQCNESLVLRTP